MDITRPPKAVYRSGFILSEITEFYPVINNLLRNILIIYI